MGIIDRLRNSSLRVRLAQTRRRQTEKTDFGTKMAEADKETSAATATQVVSAAPLPGAETPMREVQDEQTPSGQLQGRQVQAQQLQGQPMDSSDDGSTAETTASAVAETTQKVESADATRLAGDAVIADDAVAKVGDFEQGDAIAARLEQLGALAGKTDLGVEGSITDAMDGLTGDDGLSLDTGFVDPKGIDLPTMDDLGGADTGEGGSETTDTPTAAFGADPRLAEGIDTPASGSPTPTPSPNTGGDSGGSDSGDSDPGGETKGSSGDESGSKGGTASGKNKDEVPSEESTPNPDAVDTSDSPFPEVTGSQVQRADGYESLIDPGDPDSGIATGERIMAISSEEVLAAKNDPYINPDPEGGEADEDVFEIEGVRGIGLTGGVEKADVFGSLVNPGSGEPTLSGLGSDGLGVEAVSDAIEDAEDGLDEGLDEAP